MQRLQIMWWSHPSRHVAWRHCRAVPRRRESFRTLCSDASGLPGNGKRNNKTHESSAWHLRPCEFIIDRTRTKPQTLTVKRHDLLPSDSLRFKHRYSGTFYRIKKKQKEEPHFRLWYRVWWRHFNPRGKCLFVQGPIGQESVFTWWLEFQLFHMCKV